MRLSQVRTAIDDAMVGILIALLELRIRNAKLLPCPPPAAPAWVDVVLPNGDLVRLMPGTDAATLACVLAAAAELGSGRRHSR